MRVGQYQAVKAFGDKPRLMTRKSVVALICTGPLAHRRKAVSYTPRRPLISLGICLTFLYFWGAERSKNSAQFLLVFLSKTNLTAFSLFFFFTLVLRQTPPENMKGKTGLFGLAASWRKISFGHSVRQFSVNWSLLLWELG